MKGFWHDEERNSPAGIVQNAMRVAAFVVAGLSVVALIGCASAPRSSDDPTESDPSFFVDDDGPQLDSLPPPGYTVKGNISVTTGAKLYHVPGMRDYDETVVDLSRGERWFRTEQEAIANGWSKAGR
jgi:hypothetical protein